ncbi:MAG: L,D-transpeptidase family protein [Gammaproteobacteria bacterium]
MIKRQQSCTHLRHFFAKAITVIGLTLFAFSAHALSFTIPSNGDDVVGRVYMVTSQQGDTLRTIGYRYDVGHREMYRANPHVSPEAYLKMGSEILIPAQFILPPGPRKGIVINLAEYRLYYYIPGSNKVLTFPIGIGKSGWETPLFTGRIIKKKEHPEWNVPKSVKQYNLSRGIVLPDVMPAGPHNPLGNYALYTSKSGILIHGTNVPLGVGSRVSSGCIRLYPKDIKKLFQHASVGTSVRVIYAPYKVGTLQNQVYLEAHPNLSSYSRVYYSSLTPLLNTIMRDYSNPIHGSLNWRVVKYVATKQYGVPQKVSQ